MSMEYIRDFYNVPAYRGQRVKYCGNPGRIISTRAAYLNLKMDNGQIIRNVHPEWEMEYTEVLK